MASDTPSPSASHPALVAALFADEATLEQAIARLTLLGVDRADMTVPKIESIDQAAGLHDSEAPTTDTDARQMRTLQASLAAVATAFTASGVVIATGGAALPALAAAAAGLAGGGAAGALSTAAQNTRHEERATAAAEGRLILKVNLRGKVGTDDVIQALLHSGAMELRAPPGSSTAT